jgi:hypothetical protein
MVVTSTVTGFEVFRNLGGFSGVGDDASDLVAMFD